MLDDELTLLYRANSTAGYYSDIIVGQGKRGGEEEIGVKGGIGACRGKGVRGGGMGWWESRKRGVLERKSIGVCWENGGRG